jgi:hypothetical protein
VSPRSSTRVSTRTLVLVGVAVALLIAGVLSFYASSEPDGLTKVSEDHGFASTGSTHHALLSYGGWSGALGAVVVLAVIGGLVLLLRRRRTPHED